ncbi:MAG: AraC family transcriptional regulator [Ruminococcus sp.]|nr:AraC family transcriptional regulator [Ruminococcus sp.]
MSVTEVAENVGYTDVRNFRRIFKRYYGVTPTKYRDKR